MIRADTLRGNLCTTNQIERDKDTILFIYISHKFPNILILRITTVPK